MLTKLEPHRMPLLHGAAAVEISREKGRGVRLFPPTPKNGQNLNSNLAAHGGEEEGGQEGGKDALQRRVGERGLVVAEDAAPICVRLSVGETFENVSAKEEQGEDVAATVDEEDSDDEWAAEEARHQAKMKREENMAAMEGGLFDDGGVAVENAVRQLAKLVRRRENDFAAGTSAGDGEDDVEIDEESLTAIRSNMFRYSDPETFDTFLCVFAVLSAFNHSCRPNACVLLPEQAGGFHIEEKEEGKSDNVAADGGKSKSGDENDPAALVSEAPFRGVCRVVLIRDLEPGEEICIDYGVQPLLLPLAARRRELEEGWGFVCHCERCEQPLETDALLEETTPSPLSELEEKRSSIMFDVCTGAALLKGNDDGDKPSSRLARNAIGLLPEQFFDDAWMKRCSDFLASDSLGEAHWRKLVVREMFLPYLLGDGDWKLSRRLLVQHVRGLRKLLPPFHVAKVTFCRTLHLVLTRPMEVGGLGLADDAAHEQITKVEPDWPELRRIFLRETV